MQTVVRFLCLSLISSILLTSQSLFAASVSCSNAVKDEVSLPTEKDLQVAAQALVMSIENHYGPRQLKSETIHLKWEKAKEQLFSDIKGAKTQSEALRVFTRFLLSLNDAHVSVSLPTNYEAYLPLQFNYVPVDRAIYLTHVDPMLLSLRLRSGELPPLGAELVKINGTPIFEFQSKYPSFNADGNNLTNRAMFARSLSNLRESKGFPLSLEKDLKWTFTFRVRNPETKLVEDKDVVLEYTTRGVPMIDALSTLPKPDVKPEAEKPALPPENRRQTEGRVYDLKQAMPLFKLPSTFVKIELPDQLKNLFDEKRIMAGVFLQNGKRVGVLRVATYSTDGYRLDGIKQVVDYLIRQLEMKSDYLIFDQMGNPGGSVTYSDMIVQAFVGKLDGSKHMRYKLKPNQNFVRKYAETVQALENSVILPKTPKLQSLIHFLRAQYEIVHEAYRTGKDLTEPISLLGDYLLLKLYMEADKAPEKQLELFGKETDPGYRYGEEALYTKPVFMLIDHFSFSGGDATPANLKDYGRVTLIGTRTAGAGGTVNDFKHQILDVQFDYRLTTSLMYRPSAEQKYVENYGVMPDYVVEPTLNDYLNGFQGYFKKVMSIAEETLQK